MDCDRAQVDILLNNATDNDVAQVESLCKATAIGYNIVQVDTLFNRAQAHSDTLGKSERYSEGGVDQLGDIYANKAAHVDGAHIVQVGDLLGQPIPQCQWEGLRKVIVHRGLKRKRS